MQPRTESSSQLATRLANVMFGDLVGREAPYYASFEIVREPPPPSDLARTIRWQRENQGKQETRRDHVETTVFARADPGLRRAEPDELETSLFVKYSAPYDLVDIHDTAPVDVPDWEPRESIATCNLVALDAEPALATPSIVPSRWLRVVSIAVLAAAFALGVGIPFRM